MPTVLLILVALCDLRLTAELVGLRVQARLRNDADEPVEVVVGDSCAGPLFRLVIDGKPRPFVGSGRELRDAAPLRAHGARRTASTPSSPTRSTGGTTRSSAPAARWPRRPVPVPTLLRVDLKLAATAHVARGQAVDLELVHVNRSAEEVWLPACGEDRLLVDGKEEPLATTAPCDRTPRAVPIRGAFVTRGRVSLAAGRHVLRGRWRQEQSEDAIVEVGE